MIHKAKHKTGHERLVCLAADFAGLLDLIINVLSLTTYTSNFRADVLFSDWVDDDTL